MKEREQLLQALPIMYRVILVTLLFLSIVTWAQEKCPGTVHVDWMMASKPLPTRVLLYAAMYTVYASDYMYFVFFGGPQPASENLHDKPSQVSIRMFCPGVMATVDGREGQLGILSGRELPDTPQLADDLALPGARDSLPQLGKLYYEEGATVSFKSADGTERAVPAASISLPKD